MKHKNTLMTEAKLSSIWDRHEDISSSLKEKKSKTSIWDNHEDIRKNIPIERSLGKKALRTAGRAGRMLATGVASLADIPNLAAIGLHSAGLKETPEFYPSQGRAAQEAIDYVTGGRLKPEDTGEEWADFIGEGIAPLALSPLTGGASLTGTLAKSTAKGLAQKGSTGLAHKAAEKVSKLGSKPYELTGSNIAGNVGSSVGLKTYMDSNEKPGIYGSLAAGALGGLGGSGGYNFAKNPANAVAGAFGRATGHNPAEAQRLRDANLSLSAGNTSKWDQAKWLEMQMAKFLPTMGPIKKFHKKQQKQIAENMGIRDASDMKAVVEDIPKGLAEEGASGYHENKSAEFKAHAKKFKPREQAAIDNRETIDMKNLMDDLRAERNTFSPAIAEDIFDKTQKGLLLKQLDRASKSTIDQGVVNSLKNKGHSDYDATRLAVTEPTNMLYKDVDAVRAKAQSEADRLFAEVGAKTKESGEAQQLHGKLASKRHEFIETHGTPEEIFHSKAARSLWAKYQHAKHGMAKWVAKVTSSPDEASAFKKVNSNNPKYIELVSEGLPKHKHPELAEALMADMGNRGGTYNINAAHTKFMRRDKPWREKYMSLLPSEKARQHAKSTMDWITDHKELMEKLGNPSGTSHNIQQGALIGTYAGAAGSALMGHPGTLLATILLHGGAHMGARMWTNQNFMNRVSDVIKAKNAAGRTTALQRLSRVSQRVGRQYSKKIEEKEEGNPLRVTINGPVKR